MKKMLRRATLALSLLALTSVMAEAQSAKKESLTCRDNWYSDRLVGHCEIREQQLAASGAISVDGRKNGGISIKGWERGDVLVRARIQAAALTQNEAVELAKQIRIDTSGAKIFADGPERRKDYQWDVSYEIFVPKRSDVSLETHNGGISIADVHGRIEFTALNGGVVLRRIGGTVHGSTTNGGLVIDLQGDRWDGEELDVKTTNGGIIMNVPENYSAHLVTGTVNGGLTVDFPVTVQGRISRELAVNLGNGGPTIRAMTTNGGVKVRRAAANE
jgi:DUF4097 and DUF4098 domain-containing protein YvlB